MPPYTAAFGESAVPDGGGVTAGSVEGDPGRGLAGMPGSLDGSASDSPPVCTGRPSRLSSRWRSRKARASQYMEVLDRVPRDCGDSVARIVTPPSSEVRSTLPGPWCASVPATAAEESTPTDASPELLDSSAAVSFRCRPANVLSRARLLSTSPLAVPRGQEVAGLWLMNSARMSRYRPEVNDPRGGSLDSSGGRRTSAGEDPGTTASTPSPSHEPHWWQYEWLGGFSLAHWGQTLVKVLQLLHRLGPGSRRGTSDGVRAEIRVFRPGTDMLLITGRAYSTIRRQRYRRNNEAKQENG